MKTWFAAAAAVALAASAQGATLVSVSTTDDIYGAFSGSVASTATGAATMLRWQSAGYFWAGNIGLTDTAGKILFDITTSSDDTYVLHTDGTTDGVIGTACSGNASVCVVAPLATQVSLYAAINSVNGGFGICCGGSDIYVENGVAGVPEPASWGLMLAGFALTGAGLRRRIAAFA